MSGEFGFIDLFAGCGGLSSGFHAHSDFKQIVAVDNWSTALETLRLNFPDASTLCDDLGGEAAYRELLTRVRQDCDVIIGGPPCQGFSTLGKREIGCKKSALVDIFLEVCLKLRPKILVMENVRGFKSKLHPNGLPFADHLKSMLIKGRGSAKYAVRETLIDCTELELAQTRTRYVCVAVRADQGRSESVLDEFFAVLKSQSRKPRATLRDAISDLPRIRCREGAWEITLPNGEKVFNHQSLNYSPKLESRFKCVPPGGGLLDVPTRLLTPHLKRMVSGKYGSGGHVKNIYGRLEWDKPAGTVVAGMDKITCGRFVHPEEDRLLTPRECARLQGFPDDFRFLGGMVSQYYMIGNAVPPPLSSALAKSVFAAMSALRKPTRKLRTAA